MNNKPKIKIGQEYYLVLHKRDWSYGQAVVAPVRVLRRASRGNDFYLVEQLDCCVTNRIKVHPDWLAPHTPKAAASLLHNRRQWEKRIGANSWRFSLTHETARPEVLKALSELSEKNQREIWAEIKKVWPDLLKTARSFKLSKMKMKHWSEIAWATIARKYPLKEVWPDSGKD